MTPTTIDGEMPRQTIVGIFADDRRAAEALRDLAAAGFEDDHVQLVAGDAGPGRISRGLSAIGRALGRNVPWGPIAGARTGGPVVSVRCAVDEREFAAQLLDGAGASEVREEAEPG